jgi:hypothetical protein
MLDYCKANGESKRDISIKTGHIDSICTVRNPVTYKAIRILLQVWEVNLPWSKMGGVSSFSNENLTTKYIARIFLNILYNP